MITTSGVKIEVKTSAYLQAWSQKRLSTISFTGLKKRKLGSRDNTYAAEATYNADLYVFCVQTEKDPLKWDALNLDQWQFYMLRWAELADLDQKTLSLGPLAKMCPEMDAVEFQTKASAAIETIAKSPQF